MFRLRRLYVLVAAFVAWPAVAMAADPPPAAEGSHAASDGRPAADTAPLPASAETPAPAQLPTQKVRWKPLQVSVGLPPGAEDLGSEADILGVRDLQEQAAILDRWSFSLKGSLRIPMRIGIGPRNDGREGKELHSLPRIVGLGSGDWNYAALAPNASASIRITVGNPVVAGTISFGTSHLTDPSFAVIDDVGLDQAYLTLKFPNAFGSRGGIAVMAGVFSERYGTAGPYQKSSGYYSTYLFGRTHQAGESITADVDLSDTVELIVENGIGAKTEVVPFFANGPRYPDGPPEQDFLPGQQAQPYGSTFVYHSHAALVFNNWIRVGGHFLTSWSPDDNTLVPGGDVPISRLNVIGGDIHLDKELYSLYVGYSHLDGNNLYPLGDAVQVLHSGTGRALKLNYFGQKDRFSGVTPSNVSGRLDTILTQFFFSVAGLLGDPFGGHDLNVALYSMYNHARSPKTNPSDPNDLDITDDKLKFGADLDFQALRFMSVGSRFDRVIPKLADTSDAYTAISPRMSFYTKFKSKEQVIVQYTHFFLGPKTVPGSPYTDGYYKADPDMITVVGRMSF